MRQGRRGSYNLAREKGLQMGPELEGQVCCGCTAGARG